jgi:CBS domain-containing protein
MAPIDLDNLAAAQKLSEVYEIRSVPISYLLMITVDDKHLFMFSMPSSGRTLSGSLFHLENMFYTNDRLYVARVGDVLKDIWKRGVDIREMVSREAPETAYPRVTVSDAVTEVIDSMTQSNANSVIVTENKNPVGVITERDLLEKIVKPRKDPDKIRARQIMSIPIFAADSGESLIEATKIMKKTGVRKLAVFRNGRLVGMLTMK